MDCQDAVCISMSAGRRHGYYRFSWREDVFYVEAHPDASIQDNHYGFPPAIRRRLGPRPPLCNWVDINGQELGKWSAKQLEQVEQSWHPVEIDLRELEPIKYLNECVCQCRYKSQLVVAKIARFEFEIQYIQQESRTYKLIDGLGIGPRFLGHLTENGRVMGVLLEYVPSRNARSSDLDVCLSALRRLHGLGILLNDTINLNFLVSIDGAGALLCDFSNCLFEVDDIRLQREEDDLENSLEHNFGESDDDFSEFGQERLKDTPATWYRI
jgi:hypothetical protein